LKRKPNSHKKDYGHVFVLAGSLGLSGAAVLCCQAAMRSGAGLVTLGVPKSLNSVMESKLTEVMTLPLSETGNVSLSLEARQEIEKFIDKVDVMAIGPGLSQDKSTQALIRSLIMSCEKPMVIDADGLNALAGYLDDLSYQINKLRSVKILTPHPKELSRLTGESIDHIQKNRENIASDFAKKNSATVVLKGYKTVVASPDNKTYVNETGNPGMATAGSGDVLTGVIASFLAQKLNPFDAAKFAVYIHGLAGDLAVKEKTVLGLIASDIIDKIPEAIKRSF